MNNSHVLGDVGLEPSLEGLGFRVSGLGFRAQVLNPEPLESKKPSLRAFGGERLRKPEPMPLNP